MSTPSGSAIVPPFLPRPIRSLRFDGESDDAFRARAERAAGLAKVLVAACLENECVRQYIDDPQLPQYSVESVLRNPIVRVEFEQAIAIGGIGECLDATASKKWGAGPHVLPLQVDDWFYPDRITYVFRPNSLYNRRFHQRRRMKRLLRRDHRRLVERAKASTKQFFLKRLSDEQRRVIARVFQVSPAQFWRAAKGKAFLQLPQEFVQGELQFP